MSRISHDSPMKAFDKIADRLTESAGPDGIISRKDAKELGREMRRDGEGSESLAAGKIFRMADRYDSKPGNRVTVSDLANTRRFVEEQLLESADKNRNGYSAAEIATMTTTGKALIELGRSMEAQEAKAPSRIAHDVPAQGLAHTADLLRGAAGDDGIVSRDDKDQLVGKLYREGRGTEALAVAYFFGLTDARDHGAGNRVTEADIAKAQAFAGDAMLRNKDRNNNGYSQAEVENFSTTAKAFLNVGRLIEAGIIR
ncbi:MAG: hypothetical protein VX405_05920 [Myxococcota bacterium]|nr:hypothetical protein [Myxococcales bacterium]MEC7751024.1 hypothetical protein [Myxococcota bacterium]HBU49244.1 hypothetical protein [Myxococcales bacterium]|tara:strand:+ start:101 stop:868 length:768 start_codon:yes stop_codon:yes gene_type:complete